MQTIFAAAALIEDGWTNDVLIGVGDDGRIASIARNEKAEADSVHVETVLPAACNVHSHTFQRAMAGLAERRGPSERDSFWTWREIMYRFLDLLSPEDIEAIAAFAFMEMQEAGFAAVGEFHYLHNQSGGTAYDDPGELSARIAAAQSATGIGLTLLPVYYAQGGVDGRPLAGGQLRFGSDMKRFAALMQRAGEIVGGLAPDTVLGVAPHSLRAVAPEDLEKLTQILPKAPFHMHIAEQEAEIGEAVAELGARPVEWLLANMPVDRRWCLIHSTHMEPRETEALAKSGATAGLCPVTEANLGDGIFDGARFLAAGGSFGIGSDSNIRITVNEELRQLEYSQRLRDRARVVLAGPGQSAGRVLYDHALAGGARALGRAGGRIALGLWADLVALRREDGIVLPGHPDLPLDKWIFAGDGAVSDVWSAGRHTVTGGRHIRREAIAGSYGQCLARLAARL